jgi:hypothetical protein
MMMLPHLLFIYNYVRNDLIDEALGTLIMAMLHMTFAMYTNSIGNFNACEIYDCILHDIPPEEEEEIELLPRQNIRFDSWTNQTCYHHTNFTKDHLLRIYECFLLRQIADQTNGFIKVPTGHVNQRGRICCYNFHPEELFLYLMTRMKTGMDHTEMSNIFGGSTRRWSYAWAWIMIYLDTRYINIIGHQGLLRFVDQFPRFFDAIQRKVQKDWIHDFDFHNGTCEVTSGLAMLPFDLFGFIDCSIDKMSRPFSGPAGDYEGAGRKSVQDIIQRAFYTGYKKLHGIKVETVLLPNGISTVFGPVSARVPDIGDTGVLQMSKLNDFLHAIQQNRQHFYQALGDGAYGGNLRCIRSYFQSLAGQPPLTDEQKKCNIAIKRCRQSIEWSYGKVSRDFAICSHPKHIMIGKRNPYTVEQLRVAHLLTNISTCLKGDQASGKNMFGCPPPKLEDYLSL